jgi:hypothetical protein
MPSFGRVQVSPTFASAGGYAGVGVSMGREVAVGGTGVSVGREVGDNSAFGVGVPPGSGENLAS